MKTVEKLKLFFLETLEELQPDLTEAGKTKTKLLMLLLAAEIGEAKQTISTKRSIAGTAGATARWESKTAVEESDCSLTATNGKEDAVESNPPAPPCQVGPVVVKYNKIHKVILKTQHHNACEACGTKHYSGASVKASTPIKTKNNPEGDGKWHVWCLSCPTEKVKVPLPKVSAPKTALQPILIQSTDDYVAPEERATDELTYDGYPHPTMEIN